MTSEPATLLQALVQQGHLSWDEAARRVSTALFERENERISLTGRHLGRIARLERGNSRPTPIMRRALEYAFGHPIDQLLSLPGVQLATTAPLTVNRTTSEVLAMAAERARRFRIMNVTSTESIELLTDEVRELALAYPTRPLADILGDLARSQDDVFALLERPQRPDAGRDLYFLASILGGMLSKASHDLGDPSAALSQSRTAWLCAEHSGHDGLRAWICGLQALISYWADRPHESIRYAQRGTQFAERAGNSSMAWLPASEARAWARLGNVERTEESIHRAVSAWGSVRNDDLDELGGIARFTESRQVYFAADALAWLPPSPNLMRYASEAVQRYSDTSAADWSFGDAAGSRTSLAIAQIQAGNEDAAPETLASVLELPPEQRINGIVHSVQRVHRAMASGDHVPGITGQDLQGEIESYSRVSLPTLPR